MRGVLLLTWFSAVRALAPEWFGKNQEIIALKSPMNPNILNKEWNMFANAFEKKYSTAEELERKETYLRTRDWIDYHNKKYTNGETKYILSINQFSDMSLEEVVRAKTGFLEQLDDVDVKQKTDETEFEEGLLMSVELPKQVHWGLKDGAPPVRDQGSCGSCWAFSALGAVEHQLNKLGQPGVSLSVQQLIDCSCSYGNQGCLGGLMTKAFNYMLNSAGVTQNSAYAYTQKPGVCRQDLSNLVNIKEYKRMDKSKEELVMQVIAVHGPVCAAMDASLSSAYAYSGGIYDDCYCNASKVNHGVLICGYGSEDGVDYWVIQNSWGPQWGENGYMRITRADNLCGLLNLVSYVIL